MESRLAAGTGSEAIWPDDNRQTYIGPCVGVVGSCDGW
jgi:hypothetical protein